HPAAILGHNFTNHITATSNTVSTTLIPEIDLAITKVSSKDTGTPGKLWSQGMAVPGTTIGYTMTVKNLGPQTATSIVLQDALPTDPSGNVILLNPHFQPSQGVYDPATGIWSGLNLKSGQNISMTLTGQIDPSAPVCIFTNTATVLPPDGTVDP